MHRSSPSPPAGNETSPRPRRRPVQRPTHLQRAVQLAVHFGLQDGLAQGLRLRAQHRGPESIAREAFLRHLWMAEADRRHQGGGSRDNREHCKNDRAGLALALTSATG